jgi:hypothetical protein
MYSTNMSIMWTYLAYIKIEYFLKYNVYQIELYKQCDTFEYMSFIPKELELSYRIIAIIEVLTRLFIICVSYFII